MKVITHAWFSQPEDAEFHIYPIGDFQVGNVNVNEKLLEQVIKEIEQDPNAYWIGMGDYGDYINRSDKRFNPRTLVPWITVFDLGDIAGAQMRRLDELLTPIAPKCLGMLSGNHEEDNYQHYERDVYSDLVTIVKQKGGFPADHDLALGYQGYVQLAFYRRPDKQSGRRFTLSLHHGFGGGKRIGSKMNNMELWLWTHECDVALFGHTHNSGAIPAGVEYVDMAQRIRTKKRWGCYTGTFLLDKTQGVDGYEVRKGMLPLPYGGCKLKIRPFHEERPIRVLME